LLQTPHLLQQLIVPVSQSLIQFGLKTIQFGLLVGRESPAHTLPDQLDTPLVAAIPEGRHSSLPDGCGQQLVSQCLDGLLFRTSLSTQLLRKRVM
jgi:hypothetical protein